MGRTSLLSFQERVLSRRAERNLSSGPSDSSPEQTGSTSPPDKSIVSSAAPLSLTTVSLLILHFLRQVEQGGYLYSLRWRYVSSCLRKRSSPRSRCSISASRWLGDAMEGLDSKALYRSRLRRRALSDSTNRRLSRLWVRRRDRPRVAGGLMEGSNSSRTDLGGGV